MKCSPSVADMTAQECSGSSRIVISDDEDLLLQEALRVSREEAGLSLEAGKEEIEDPWYVVIIHVAQW